MNTNGGAAEPPPRPRALKVVSHTIPLCLKQGRQHVVWRYELRRGGKGQWKWTKPPFRPDGRNASTIDPATWVMFDEALAAYQAGGWDGIGRVLVREDGIVGLDLDRVLSAASDLDPEAAEILGLLGGYSERSPSATGVRALARGRKPGPKCRKGKFQRYDGGGRYLTLTGHTLDGSTADVPDRQAGVEAVYREVFGNPKPPVPRPAPASPDIPGPDLTDGEIIERAKRAKNAEKFTDLWDGGSGGHGSPSEGDLALAVMLAFWTRKDAERIATLFAQSARGRRAKWAERADYRERTIARAIELCAEVYDPERPLPPRPHQAWRRLLEEPSTSRVFEVEV